jgi:hypothetical protein
MLMGESWGKLSHVYNEIYVHGRIQGNAMVRFLARPSANTEIWSGSRRLRGINVITNLVKDMKIIKPAYFKL